MSTIRAIKQFESLLNYLHHIGDTNSYNIQLAHLENAVNREKMNINSNYRKEYRNFRRRLRTRHANYMNRVERGRKMIANRVAATTIQRHVRGMQVRKTLQRPSPILVQNPNGTFIIVKQRPNVLSKITAAKKAANRERQAYFNRIRRLAEENN